MLLIRARQVWLVSVPFVCEGLRHGSHVPGPGFPNGSLRRCTFTAPRFLERTVSLVSRRAVETLAQLEAGRETLQGDHVLDHQRGRLPLPRSCPQGQVCGLHFTTSSSRYVVENANGADLFRSPTDSEGSRRPPEGAFPRVSRRPISTSNGNGELALPPRDLPS